MKKILLSLLALSLSQLNFAQTLDAFIDKSDEFFKEFVVDGKVAYKVIAANPAKIDTLISLSGKLDMNSEDIESSKAFWINAYNLIVIKEISSKYPLASVNNLKGFFDIRKHNIAGAELTLNEIEKRILKNTFKDPLINFVLVCGASGCPPLMNKAYRPNTLKEQMLERIKNSINDKNFIKVNDAKKTVEISEIFDWYKEEFIDKESKILSFINSYRKEKINESYTIKYYKYDWNLNGVE